MKLSIVIVNYNVRYFLSNCLQSVYKAIESLNAEVFVVDNNSTDQSVDMVKSDFPQVILIDNDFNAGFSKANNQAIEQAKGEYILLLNPDTVVEEDCFNRCIEYMDEHSASGGMGVKMINGSGMFLPESKRGLPTPTVAFFKIFGLSALFPKSKIFGKYHLGYLDENKISEVDVLSGAFMLIRKTVVDKIGGLDEAFFMYGEDIDMSYRITAAGYQNIYFPKSRIIHFKGESTKKSSVNYVLVFYRAMIIFARKHFSQKNARLFSFLINLAIYFRAFIALFSRFLTKLYMPVFDFVVFWLMLLGIKELYENYVLGMAGYFPQTIEKMAFPVLITCWIIGQLLLGGYHQPVKFKNVFKGLLTGALLVFILYALLDETLRFSRVVVVSSVLSSFLVLHLSRIILMKLGIFKLIRFTEINSAIVGSQTEINKVKRILSESPERKKKLFFINPREKSKSGEDDLSTSFIGSLHQFKDIIKIYNIDELIFCLKDVRSSDLIDIMQHNRVRNCSIYLHPASGDYLLKSSSIQSSGEFILPEDNPLLSHSSKLKKNIFEKLLVITLLLFSPFIFFIYRRPQQFFHNIFGVLFGRYSLVGLKEYGENVPYILPALRLDIPEQEMIKKRIDYLLNYGIEKDLEIVIARINQLDNNPIN